MRTMTIKKKVYRFSELSEKAKQHAKDEYATHDYDRGDELLKSLKELVEHFRGKITDYSIFWDGCGHSYASFDMPEVVRPDEDTLNLLGDGVKYGDHDEYGEMTLDEFEARLQGLGSYHPETLRGDGGCVLTGVCWDEDAIDPVRQAYIREGTTDLYQLMRLAFDGIIRAGQADYEDFYSDETFGEHSDANDWEYDEDGDLI